MQSLVPGSRLRLLGARHINLNLRLVLSRPPSTCTGIVRLCVGVAGIMDLSLATTSHHEEGEQPQKLKVVMSVKLLLSRCLSPGPKPTKIIRKYSL